MQRPIDQHPAQFRAQSQPSTPPRCAPASDAPGAMPESRARAIDSRELLHGRAEVRILHAGIEYRLRQTRSNKLILTK
jgi:hemin uptake protein HemP